MTNDIGTAERSVAAASTAPQPRRWGDWILLWSSIAMFTATLVTMYLAKQDLLVADFNTTISSLVQTYKSSVCTPGMTADQCTAKLEELANPLRRSLLDSVSKYSDQIVPSWTSQAAIAGFAGFLLVMLGFKRFESIDTMISEGQTRIRQELRSSIKEIEELATSKVSQNLQTKVGEWVTEKEDEIRKSLMAEVEAMKKLKETLDSEYHWLKTDIASEEDSALLEVQSVEQAHNSSQELHAKGKAFLAQRVLEQIVTQKLSGEPDDFFNASTQALQMGNLKLALDIVEFGLTFSPDSPDLKVNRARVLSHDGRQDDADSEFSAMAANDDTLRQYWRVSTFYTDLLIERGRMTDADALINRYKELTSQGGGEKVVAPLTNYALALERQGKVSDALNELQDILKRSPVVTGAAYNLARILRGMGRLDEALTHAETALVNSSELQPDMSANRILHLRGEILEGLYLEAKRKGNTAEAEALLERALQSYELAVTLPGKSEYHVKLRSVERLTIYGRGEKFTQSAADVSATEAANAIAEQLQRIFARGTGDATTAAKADN